MQIVTKFPTLWEFGRNEKFEKYIDDSSYFVSPYQFDEDPKATITKFMTDVGFRDIKIEIKDHILGWEDENDFLSKFFS